MNNLVLGYVGTVPRKDGQGCAKTIIDHASGYPCLIDGLNLRTSLIKAIDDLKSLKSIKTHHGGNEYDWDNLIVGSVVIVPVDSETVDEMIINDIMKRASQQFTEEELKIIAKQIS